jgi:hypothetical protein
MRTLKNATVGKENWYNMSNCSLTTDLVTISKIRAENNYRNSVTNCIPYKNFPLVNNQISCGPGYTCRSIPNLSRKKMKK